MGACREGQWIPKGGSSLNALQQSSSSHLWLSAGSQRSHLCLLLLCFHQISKPQKIQGSIDYKSEPCIVSFSQDLNKILNHSLLLLSNPEIKFI